MFCNSSDRAWAILQRIGNIFPFLNNTNNKKSSACVIAVKVQIDHLKKKKWNATQKGRHFPFNYKIYLFHL